MVSDHGRDRLGLTANLLPKGLGSALVLDGEEEVAFVVSGRFKCALPLVQEYPSHWGRGCGRDGR